MEARSMTAEDLKRVDYLINSAATALGASIADFAADGEGLDYDLMDSDQCMRFCQANASLAIAMMLRDQVRVADNHPIRTVIVRTSDDNPIGWIGGSRP